MGYYPEPDSPAKKKFIVWKAEIDKLDIDKLVNVPSGLTKKLVDDLYVDKFKTAPVD